MSLNTQHTKTPTHSLEAEKSHFGTRWREECIFTAALLSRCWSDMFSDKWKINIKWVWLFLVSWLTAAQVEMQFLEWSYADVLPGI